MGTTKIEWTATQNPDSSVTPGKTWTPLRARVRQNAAQIAQAKGYTSLVQIAEKMAGHVGPHCERVSAECDHCYSETNNHRCLPSNGTGFPFDRRARDLVEPFVDEKILIQPAGWKKPRRIFVCSQTDLFGEWNTFEMIDEVFTAMIAFDWHTYQILTKRPKRMREYFASGRHDGGLGPDRADYHLGQKIWLGVSAGTQAAAAERIPELLRTPAAVRFVSAEPLLSRVDVSPWLRCADPGCDSCSETDEPGIDWVICGGESGPGARPMHPDWARKLRDDCASAGVPFFFKQWGEWVPDGDGGGPVQTRRKEAYNRFPDGQWIARVGKHAAGRLLDGVEHNDFPATASPSPQSSGTPLPSLDRTSER